MPENEQEESKPKFCHVCGAQQQEGLSPPGEHTDTDGSVTKYDEHQAVVEVVKQ